ncbi:hypothetical protein BC940DRAFT_307430 [Gongronella butleri]|nr:hypothetical protein BC940DRAFT_307430 [Gongronella butleri]
MAADEELFDLQSLEYVGTVDSNLECIICQDVLSDPVVTPCDHTFCKDCITQAVRVTSRCPVDRKHLTASCLKPASRIIVNILNELPVHCMRQSRGCTYQCQVQLMKHHVENECDYVYELCSIGGCQEKIIKKDRELHATLCRFRDLRLQGMKPDNSLRDTLWHTSLIFNSRCQYCNTMHERANFANHAASCFLKPVPCPKGCPYVGPRKNLATHLCTGPQSPPNSPLPSAAF